jgi:hypothetical protein
MVQSRCEAWKREVLAYALTSKSKDLPSAAGSVCSDGHCLQTGDKALGIDTKSTSFVIHQWCVGSVSAEDRGLALYALPNKPVVNAVVINSASGSSLTRGRWVLTPSPQSMLVLQMH